MAQISLMDYRTAAADYSRTAQSAAWNTVAAYHTLQQQRTTHYPSAQASVDASASFRRTVSNGSTVRPYALSVTPSVTQSVYSGGGVNAAVGKARTVLARAMSDERQTLLDVRYDADLAYWNFATDVALCAAQQRYTAIVRSLRDVVAVRFNDGYIGKGDLLMTEAQLSDAAYKQIIAERKVLSSRHAFNTLLGIWPDSLLLPADSLGEIPPLPQRVPLDSVYAARPDMVAARLAVEQQRFTERIVRAPYLPSVDVGVNGVLKTLTPNMNGSMRIDGGVYVSLAVPIYSFGARRSAESTARAVTEQSYLALQTLSDNVRRDEADAWSNLVQSYAQVRQSRESLAIAAENLDLSTFSYSEGRIAILDVLSAQLSWIQLFNNSISALSAYRTSYAAYMYVTAQ